MVKSDKLSEGVISETELYTIEQVKRRLSLTNSAMRSLRAAGLPVIRIGKRGFLLGKQILQFFEEYEDANKQSKSCQPQIETETSSEVERPRERRVA